MRAIRGLRAGWRSYRHRFVPWMLLNLSRNEKTLRQVSERSRDKLVPDAEVYRSLLSLFTVLLRVQGLNPGPPWPQSTPRPPPSGEAGHGVPAACGQEAMLRCLGFCIERRASSIAPSAGTGVYVRQGLVPAGATVAMYPGTVYQPHEPILLQSIRNPFVFRYIDGVLLDGRDRGLSRVVFRSCSGRDRLGPFSMSDVSWLTDRPANPLAVGQYVNNCSNRTPANVCYQELDVPEEFPVELHQFLPNVNYSAEARRPLRCVVLVSLRDIAAGEELFSNYYTIVH